MPSQGGVPRNRLLAALQPEVLAALLPKCNPLILKSRQQLYRADAAIDAVYFVEAGMISLVANLDDGMQAEIGIVGREGMLGVSLLSGIDKSFVDSMVQKPGVALRMAVRDFRHEMDVNAAFSRSAGALQRSPSHADHADSRVQWAPWPGTAPRTLVADGARSGGW
jgi:CRP-like cAMP-binding protein